MICAAKNTMEFRIVHIRRGGVVHNHLSAIKYCNLGPPKLGGRLLVGPLPEGLDQKARDLATKILGDAWGQSFTNIDIDDWEKWLEDEENKN